MPLLQMNFIVTAERDDTPARRHYEDFPQFENGVGMLSLFEE